MKANLVFNVVAAIVLISCIGLGLWNHFQDQAIGKIGETVVKADSLANVSLNIAGKAESTSKDASKKSKEALKLSKEKLAKADSLAYQADSLANQAREEARKARSGWGHDMTARQAVYRLVVQKYYEAGYDLDSAKTLAEKFVVDPKSREDHFYGAKTTKADSLLKESLVADSLAVDSLAAAK